MYEILGICSLYKSSEIICTHLDWFKLCKRRAICTVAMMNSSADKYTRWEHRARKFSFRSYHPLSPCCPDTLSPRPTLSKFKVARGNDSFPPATRSGPTAAERRRQYIHTFARVNEPSGGSHAANYNRPKKISRYHVRYRAWNISGSLAEAGGKSFGINFAVSWWRYVEV